VGFVATTSGERVNDYRIFGLLEECESMRTAEAVLAREISDGERCAPLSVLTKSKQQLM
jgi:hypothetical protein